MVALLWYCNKKKSQKMIHYVFTWRHLAKNFMNQSLSTMGRKSTESAYMRDTATHVAGPPCQRFFCEIIQQK